MREKPKNGLQRQRFRVIAGEWRGRRLSFPPLEGIRPSPDRVRETLFNWLGPRIEGARCLDLCAGSGALGLEALSRGAGEVVFVDQNRSAAEAIAQHLETLDCNRGRVICDTAEAFLGRGTEQFDVVFLDPPFGKDLLPRLCTLIEQNGRLAAGARVYLECELKPGKLELPDSWSLVRSKQAGQVGYHLATRDNGKS